MIQSPPREKLQEIEARSRRERMEDRSLWRLIQSIHSDPALRALVTLESQPLHPAVELSAEGGEAMVHLLLALPNGVGGFQLPWAYLAWGWPSRRLKTFSDIRDRMGQNGAVLTEAHRCSQEFAVAVQTALEEGRRPPLPPAPIPDLVRRVLAREGEIPAPEAAPAPAAPKAAPQATAPRPFEVDSGTDLLPKLQETEKLLRPLGSPDLEREWRRLHGRLTSNRFSIVVIGERGRGKSTLINHLLGRDLLPTGLLDRKPSFVEIDAASESFLETVSPAGERRKQPLSTESLLAAIAGSQAQGGEVKVGTENPWLAAGGIRLIEIPGSDDLGEEALGQLVDAMAAADAVLVVVSATMALALTEKAFVERYVLERQVPRVAVALTHLDTVKPQERQEVVDFVRRKIADWGSGIPLCVSQDSVVLQDSDQEGGVITGAEGLRTLLSTWALSGERRSLIHRQVRENLRHLLGLARTLLETRRQAAGLAAEELELQVSQARRRLEGQRLDWEDLRLQMDRRQIGCRQWLEDEMRERNRRILSDLLYELRRQSHPKEWWERDLPPLLGRRLEDAEKGLQQTLEGRLLKDAKWLAGEVGTRFSRRLDATQPPEKLELESDNLPEPPESLYDLHRLRLFVRGGSIAAAYLGWQLLPFGMLFSGGTLLVGEVYLKREVERQREVLADALPDVLERIIYKGLTLAELGLQKAYAELLEAFQREQEAWLRVELQGLEATKDDGGLGEVERRLADVNRLQKALGA
jgi:hypothetical protein